MNRRIFPLNINDTKTWKNWSSYINWLDSEIESINSYLKYWNPDYIIYGQTLYSNDYITGELKEIFKNSKTKEVDGESKKIIDLRELKWREGAFVSEEGVKLVVNGTSKEISAKPYTTYFPKRWSHKGLQETENSEFNKDFYYAISAPIAALYMPFTSEGKITFTYVENGQKVIGTNLFFPLEFSPSRYFLTQKNNAMWKNNGIQWNEEGVYWSDSDEDGKKESIIHISNADGQVWSNNYPLMHECYIKIKKDNEPDSFEEFIFDNDFSVEMSNIANYSTMIYNINAQNITSDETASWNDFVYVQII